MPMLDLPVDFPLVAFVTEVSPNDEMFDFSEHYVSTALSALKLLDYAVEQGLVRPNPQNLLDLPCGHGRVARVLRSRFPHADLTVCDLNRDGVDFCASRFDARGIYGTDDLDTINLNQIFDIIWVGSLITHLNQNNTVKFIRSMQRHLSVDGLLIMSSHGTFVSSQMRAGDSYNLDYRQMKILLCEYDTLGYGYQDYPQQAGYGISIISRQWFEVFFAGESYGIVAYLEHEWDGHHDILYIKKK
jgi:SAM-dependent methyltransferase